MIVLRVIGFANGVPCPHAGQYVETFDFEAHNGVGYGEFTRTRAKAKRFRDLAAALAFVSTTSATHPIRTDGKPNRPLRAATIEFETV